MSAAAAFISPATHVARASACAARPRRLRAPITRGAVASSSSSAPSSKKHNLPTFPGGWLGPDLAADPSAWTHRLTDDEIAELDAALASAEAAGLDVIDLTPDNFPLPSLASRLTNYAPSSFTAAGSTSSKGFPSTGTRRGNDARCSTAWARTWAGRARRTRAVTSSGTSKI